VVITKITAELMRPAIAGTGPAVANVPPTHLTKGYETVPTLVPKDEAHEADWSFEEAALHGSSHYDLPGILRWFTANIGIHHIHHLCSRIPFYRLLQRTHSLPFSGGAGSRSLSLGAGAPSRAPYTERAADAGQRLPAISFAVGAGRRRSSWRVSSTTPRSKPHRH
jgi:fatty acid desaturase